MTWINDTTSKFRLATLGGGAAISALLTLGTFAVPASAQWNSNPGYQQNYGGAYYTTLPHPWSTARPTGTATTATVTPAPRAITHRRWFTAPASASAYPA